MANNRKRNKCRDVQLSRWKELHLPDPAHVCATVIQAEMLLLICSSLRSVKAALLHHYSRRCWKCRIHVLAAINLGSAWLFRCLYRYCRQTAVHSANMTPRGVEAYFFINYVNVFAIIDFIFAAPPERWAQSYIKVDYCAHLSLKSYTCTMLLF